MTARRFAAVVLPLFISCALQAAQQAPPAPPLNEDGCIDGRGLDYIRRHGIDGRIDPEALLYAVRLHKDEMEWRGGASRFTANGVGGSAWTSIGPTNGGGRMTAIAPHPTIANTALLGAADGGLWKTTNAGASWSVLTDSIGNLSVGAVTYAPSDPTKIYLGTGENAYAGDVITGIGLLYSSDGGVNWTLPSSVIAQQFFRISVHPTNPNEIVAATSSGLLRSTNGQNGPWTNPATFSHATYGDVADLVRDPANPLILYASTNAAGYGFYLSPRVLKSSDGGATWSESSSGLTSAGTPTSRVSIVIAPSSTSILYAAYMTGDSVSHMYKSTSSGASWSELTAVSSSSTYNISHYHGGQGSWNNALAVLPSDANTIVAGGVHYIRSTDGGTTWSNTFATPSEIHVDNRDLKYDAGGLLYVACDGGVYTSGDSGNSWSDRNTNLVTRQFYTLTLDAANRNRMFGGLQDNGTLRRPDAGGTSWDTAFGGDGFDVAIDRDAPSRVLISYQWGNVLRTVTAGGSLFTQWVNPPYASTEYVPFSTRVVPDPNAPQTIYTASNRLWKSTAFGDGWTPVSTTTTDGSNWPTQTQVTAMAIAQSNSQIIMVSLYDQLFRTTNGGTSWTSVRSGLPLGRGINSIAVDPSNASLVYVALGGLASDSLYYSTNGGTSWSVRATGLPLFSAQVVRIDPTDSTTLYCGTDVGVYRSTNSGASWSLYGSGMPAVSVYDLQVLNDGTKLRAATHGRGVWELTVTSPSNNAPAVSASSTPAAVSGVVSIAPGAQVTFNGTFSDADNEALTAKWFFPDDGTSSSAISGGNVPHTFGRAGRYPVTLRVTDAKGGVGTASIDVVVAELADSCSSAAVIPPSGPFPYTVSVNSEIGSAEGSDPPNVCFPYSMQSTMWVSFTPPSTASYRLSLAGSQSSVILMTYSGTACGPYTRLPYCLTRTVTTEHNYVNLDASSASSKVDVSLTGGTTYFFELVNYYNSDFGRQSLTIAPFSGGIAVALYEAGPAVGTQGGGQTVTLSGYGFVSGASATFGGTAATNVTVVSSNMITCTAPAHAAGTVDVTVTSNAKTATLRGGYTYLPATAPAAPTNVVAAATSSTSVHVSWTAPSGADSYEIYRGATLAGTLNSSASGTLTFDDNAASANTAYLYRVRALNAGSSSGDSAPDLATTILFTDDPLVATATTIKATHLTQLRTAVNAVRTLASLGAATITDSSPAGVKVKAVHITELRTALDAARTILGLSALSYTHTLTPQSTKVFAADFAELRNGVK